jgi:hypothetical protein
MDHPIFWKGNVARLPTIETFNVTAFYLERESGNEIVTEGRKRGVYFIF